MRRKFKKTKKKLKREKREEVKRKRMEGRQNERRRGSDLLLTTFSVYFVGLPRRPLDCSLLPCILARIGGLLAGLRPVSRIYI